MLLLIDSLYEWNKEVINYRKRKKIKIGTKTYAIQKKAFPVESSFKFIILQFVV